MGNEKIREWIEEKLEKGIEEDRIKDSLENTGHDPGLVDEVMRSETSDKEEELFDSEETDKDDTDDAFNFASSDEDTDEDKSFSFPGISLSLPDFNRRMISVLLLSFLVVTGMAGFFSYTQNSGIFEPQCSGEEGVGVKVYDVYTEEGSTIAEVNAYEEVSVVLEVFDSGQKIGQKVERYDSPGNRRTISVNAIGDSVSFHEYGCEEPSVERNY